MSPKTFYSRTLSCFLVFLALPYAKAEQTWTEVRSPHFRVLTNGSGKDARKVANEFEQMRHVFVLRFHDDKMESGAPLTIVAAQDGETLKELDAHEWSLSKGNLSGVFFSGWERQFAIVRLDTWGDNNEIVVFHEYTHSILHLRAHWLPVWLDEGMAEFYSYTRFEQDRTLIGAPSVRLRELRENPLLPVTTMLDINQHSPYYHDEDKVQLFYAEAWAMVHYMTFGEGMNNGEKLNAFLRLLQDEVPQQKAFQQTFGDPKTFDKNFSQYLDRFTMKAGVLDPDKGMNAKTFSERKLTPAEADYEIGCIQIGSHDYTSGLRMIEKSLSLDPNLAPAHEELGFLDFDKGKDEEAIEQWKKALAEDPSLPRSLFALTMSGPSFAVQADAQLRESQITLRHITDLAPNFAPPYVELALIEWRLGFMQQAYNDAHQAEKIEPWRAGYHILTGRILLSGKQPALAADYARYVAGHWFGPDHNEAVDLWLAVPAESRGNNPPLTLDMPPNTQVSEGTLQDISCATAPGEKMAVTFTPDVPSGSKPMTFRSDGRMMIGFSDTFWWGEDHFSVCHHLAGHRAVVAYKTDGQQLLDLEIRDDLPAEKKTNDTASASAQP